MSLCRGGGECVGVVDSAEGISREWLEPTIRQELSATGRLFAGLTTMVSLSRSTVDVCDRSLTATGRVFAGLTTMVSLSPSSAVAECDRSASRDECDGLGEGMTGTTERNNRTRAGLGDRSSQIEVPSSRRIRLCGSIWRLDCGVCGYAGPLAREVRSVGATGDALRLDGVETA